MIGPSNRRPSDSSSDPPRDRFATIGARLLAARAARDRPAFVDGPAGRRPLLPPRAPVPAAPPAADRPLDLLLVEDDPDFREMAAHFLSRRGHRVAQAADGSAALATARRSEFDVAVVDMNMPGLTGLEALDRLRDIQPLMEVLILTGQGTVETAVQAMKLGACDYLTKPFPLPDLERRCQLAAGRRQLRKENAQLRTLIARGRERTEMIADSPPMRRVQDLVDRVAASDHTVLITGESGTGKEVVAKAIHERGPRADRPLVTVNCAALPEQLVESELFGHAKGAFTGAAGEQPGLFEVADGGTLLIDELGELPPALQPKLLRVLEDGSLRRVGSSTERRVDVRVLAATNRDLAAEVAAGRFREDLFYRVNVLTVHLPPLRERGDDLWKLVEAKLAGRAELDPEARALMAGYHWPGNVRQLLNALDRALILADDGVITADDLPAQLHAPAATGDAAPPVAPPSAANASPGASGGTLADRERTAVAAALREAGGNKAEAARRLGVHRRKLYRLIERHDLTADKPSGDPAPAETPADEP